MALQSLNSRRIDMSSLDQRNKAKYALVLSRIMSPKVYGSPNQPNVTLPACSCVVN